MILTEPLPCHTPGTIIASERIPKMNWSYSNHPRPRVTVRPSVFFSTPGFSTAHMHARHTHTHTPYSRLKLTSWFFFFSHCFFSTTNSSRSSCKAGGQHNPLHSLQKRSGPNSQNGNVTLHCKRDVAKVMK